jgi:hypothetical protein
MTGRRVGWPTASIADLIFEFRIVWQKAVISFFLCPLANVGRAWTSRELSPQLVTFNGNSFDLPVLRYRAMIHAPVIPLEGFFFSFHGVVCLALSQLFHERVRRYRARQQSRGRFFGTPLTLHFDFLSAVRTLAPLQWLQRRWYEWHPSPERLWLAGGLDHAGGGALPDVGPTWHVKAAADFNGDGKSDILWQHDSGLPAIWTMNGTTITAAVPFPMLGPRGTSLQQPISVATANPIFFGRTTAACRQSGPWTAPRSPLQLSFRILATTGTWFKRLSEVAQLIMGRETCVVHGLAILTVCCSLSDFRRLFPALK